MIKKDAPKIVSPNFDTPEAWRLEVYESRGGYAAAKQAFAMEPAKIIEEVKASNLRGRGGAGFPTGVKWGFLAKSKPCYLVVNADEGEPGTFKDRALMEKDPHRLLEGIIATCWAIGAHTAYVYIRGEFVLPYRRVQAAIDEAYAKGYLGKKPFGQDHPIDVYTHRGAGAYICGEETALLNSLEGKRGEPRLKPPFPAVVGAFGCPTIVNNVETLCAVPWIVVHGGKAFADLGVDKDGGTRLFGLSGYVKRPGLYELAVGVTVRELVFDVGGGVRDGHQLKGVIPGGSSTPVLLPSEIDVPMTVDGIKAAGSMLGTACAMVLDDTTCAVRSMLNLMNFYAHESCGQCTPCREGCGWIDKILARIEAGQGTLADVDLVGNVAGNILGNTICPFGDGAAMPTLAFVKKFRGEFEQHVLLKKCPQGGRFQWEAS